jgi:Na+-translocating ferredoxin:NAD+ oxidoreductase RNF subunit RnfB
MVPLYIARVADLRVGQSVSVTCRNCGHVSEIAAAQLREKVAKHEFVKHLGPQFRCRLCGFKGAEVDARRALGHSR